MSAQQTPEPLRFPDRDPETLALLEASRLSKRTAFRLGIAFAVSQLCPDLGDVARVEKVAGLLTRADRKGVTQAAYEEADRIAFERTKDLIG